MLIRCPMCEHSREVDLTKIPAHAEYATCPRCSHRFRFRALAEVDEPDDAGPTEPERAHKDVWDAMDSLHKQWSGDDAEKNGDGPANKDAERYGHDEAEGSRPTRDLGVLHEYDPVSPEGSPGMGGRADAIFIPWEQPKKLGLAASFYQTVLLVFLQPRRFFSSLNPKLPLVQALVFSILFSMMHAVLEVFLGQPLIEFMLAQTGVPALPPEYAQMFNPSRIPSILLTAPFLVTIQLFFGTWITHVIVRLVDPLQANFAKTLKVLAYAHAGYVFSAVPLLGPILGPLCYFFILLAGCRYAFSFSWGKAFMVTVPRYILSFMIIAMQFR